MQSIAIAIEKEHDLMSLIAIWVGSLLGIAEPRIGFIFLFIVATLHILGVRVAI